MCLALVISFTIVTIHASAQTIINESSINSAVGGIQRAAALGANVSALIYEFNLGLDFLRQAQDSNFRNCSYIEDCQIQASERFVSISEESAILMQQSEDALNYNRIITYGLIVPFAAFVASLSIVCLFKVWKSYKIKRFLDMEINKREE
jgi:hypothetical protein